jgi:hypothetical protein
MRSPPLAEHRRPGPATADEPTVQNPALPQVSACRDSHSTRCTTLIIIIIIIIIIITVPATLKEK